MYRSSTTGFGDEITDRLPRPVPPFARAPVLVLAALVTALLMALAPRYDLVTDELYFLAAGKFHPAWGYMDQQPLVPMLAAFLDTAFPGSLVAFRLPAALVTALGMVVTALIAREFGGNRKAQVLAAVAYPLSPWLLVNGHWLTASTMEPLQWTAMLWLLVRWVRLHGHGVRRDRLLIGIGLIAALAVQTKFQVVVLCAALLLGIALSGPRAVLARPALWVAVAIPAVTAVPTLWWQAANGWPALEMGAAVNAENDRVLLLPVALFYAGVVLGAVLCCYGLVGLLRSPALRPYRFLGWTVLVVLVFFVATGGRPNYLAGLYGVLFAAAAAGLQHRSGKILWPVCAVSAVLPLAMLPVYPLDLLARHPEIPSFPRLYETGWPELTSAVDRAYESLPPEQQRRAVIVAENYYLAGALDVRGRASGLPGVYSPHRGYWFFGAPPAEADVVIYVGERSLAAHFGRSRQLGTVRSDLVNMARGNEITLYQDPVQPWSELWPRLRTF
ncbi:Dolichyl-phosphate-mannose-protein mannosyltransferase [Saccharopolyspora antimicrobica]|uniref:Dolichyl-phosphate-mannose-protein mannosyltransferase n=1 Tax=Saccharopolyspora antimicrobica TaxID=455193 RepID=A0A1I4TLL4_9PSEU|nr:glycosyltransferase family 39 protein [Saccharopolyspora antimicrobica]RKT88462.1 dolichyl-phosphate-mannose-protein mannosyltransferase [Saccharopolyspora antimicrobica]SFM77566.1 Dolichyl-phosphate-mannose-protein mannosyltransferase [Saccharopolyspora antimicrobica]